MDHHILNIKKNNTPQILFIYLLVLLSIALAGTAGYFFYKYQKLSQNPVIEQISDQEEEQKLVNNISKLMLLPKEETPTVATVSDIDKLKDQIFFKNATNGNKVLIYPNSKLAIIYDPQANLIVNVGPINFSGQPTPSAQNPQIGLRNGTNIVGLTYKVETVITKSYPNIDVVLKEQDKRTDYVKTIVVVLNEATKDTADKIAKTLNSQIVNLPPGEIKPEGVDILIIVGKDKN